MTAAKWKKARPRDLVHAFELSTEYALAANRRKVPEIAEKMGETTSNLYKWMSTGRMPAILIPAFEHACGCDFVSRYLASSNHRLVIDIPRGRKADASDINDLQESFTDCVGVLVRFFKKKAGAEETVDSIVAAMRKLAWHQENVNKQLSPELALFADTEVEE